jgi:hypothetical protein
MKRVCLRNLLAFTFACGLTLFSTSLFGQVGSAVHVPIGPPISAASQPALVPIAPLPLPNIPSLNPLVTVGQSLEGIDYLTSTCGCLPPDTNAAVGNNFLTEVVNFDIRVYDKPSGSVLLTEPLASLFGAATGGDPEVVFDEIADRWYITAFDSNNSGLFLAVSNDGNPLDGFVTHDLTNVGGFPDYNKIGYNHDAVVISYNDFGSNGGNAAILAIDKAALLSGTLVTYNSVPAPQFRAMPPARMHGSKPGDPMWFVSTDGSDAGGSTIRVTKMTNVLSNSPTFTYTSLTVKTYKNATTADQPGGAASVTTFPNTTTAQVEYRKGHLVTAMDSALATDGFVYPKGLYYVVSVATGTPKLLKQGVIDPGRGVAVQMVSVDEDLDLFRRRHLGLTWIESSINEFVSMWVGSTAATSRIDAAPGGGFMPYSFRLGDYSSTVVDPSDGLTFWSANEYIGNDGGSDIWRTHIVSFQP